MGGVGEAFRSGVWGLGNQVYCDRVHGIRCGQWYTMWYMVYDVVHGVVHGTVY